MAPDRFWDTEPLLRESWLAPLDEVPHPGTPDTVELPRGRARGTPAAAPPRTALPPAERAPVTTSSPVPRTPCAPTPSGRLALALQDRRTWPVAAVVTIGVLAVLAVACAG